MKAPRNRSQRSAVLEQERLESFRRMLVADAVVAVPAALHFCEEYEVNVPPWLLSAANALLFDLLKRERSTKRGRSRGCFARYRQDTIDFARYCEVDELRRVQIDFKKRVADSNRYKGMSPDFRLHEEKMLEWLGSTLSRAFECASLILAKSAAYGSPDAMKRSYFQVKKSLAAHEGAMRYHMLDPNFLVRAGFPVDFNAMGGNVTTPLYKLK